MIHNTIISDGSTLTKPEGGGEEKYREIFVKFILQQTSGGDGGGASGDCSSGIEPERLKLQIGNDAFQYLGLEGSWIF